MKHVSFLAIAATVALVAETQAQPLPKLPDGYYWVSCSDPAYSNRLDCDKDRPPSLSGVSEEQWQELQDKRRCARIKAQCLRMPKQKKQACLQTYADVCG